ncbi:MAG: hypothetical protein JSS65_05865 [Armatimonadetes bacterium]|nr:hypothetical protein [Armatimonadota bacterium]
MPATSTIVYRFVAFLIACLTAVQSAFAFGAPQLALLVSRPSVPQPQQAKLPTALGFARPAARLTTPLDFGPLPAPSIPLVPGATLLSAEGEMAPGITVAQADSWRAQLGGQKYRAMKARLLVQLAEWEISRREPARAKPLLQQAQGLLKKSSLDFGLVTYDLAMVECLEGRFEQASHAFSGLLASGLKGYDHRNAALWQRHAAGCAGYHKSHWELGIPQPTELDPLCGASSLAMCLKQLGLPHAKGDVVAKVAHTGEGSTMRDLVEGASRLGVVGKFVLAEEEGFRALPKPLVAHVERDHFVTVLETNERGVDYACSDCGPWPGGKVQVTWAQWRAMEADAYLVVTKAGSEVDEAVAALPFGQSEDALAGVLVASTAPTMTKAEALNRSLRGKVWQGSTVGGNNPICGGRAGSLQCFPSCDGQVCFIVAGAQKTSDPVNVANGQEEYATPTALEIYNPVGPSVTWRPMYYSLANVTPNGFGSGWTHPYNIRIEGTGAAVAPGTQGQATLNFVAPNSAKLHFTIDLANKPSQSTPNITLPVETGFGMQVVWSADSFYPNGALNGSHFSVRSKDGGSMVFEANSMSGVAYPTRIYDKVGNSIVLNWASMVFTTVDPYRRNGPTKGLVSIVNTAGTQLLTLTYGTGGRIASARDCYGRYVYYTLATYPITGSAYTSSVDELTGVSFVTTSSLPGGVGNEYAYDYQNSGNSGGTGPDIESIPYLRTISINSPTGLGVSTATVFSGGGGLVTQTVDANGYTTKYTKVFDAQNNVVLNSTRVSVYASNLANAPLVSQKDIYFDGHMNRTKVADANGTVVENWTYGSANTPNKPSQIVDGNNRTWYYTWDQYGHMLTSKTPKNVTTTYTYDATTWPFGRLVDVQTGTLLSTQYTYWSNGLLKDVKTPVPGNVGGSTRQTTSYTYDAIGNLLTITEPGNAQYATRVTTLGYGASPKLGQPLTVTNAQGKTTNLAYDARGNVTGVTDPLGNSALAAYDILNVQVSTSLPATGNTGAGRATTTVNYSYPGGVVNSVKAYDESGAQIREVDFTYGKEGELLARTGSAEAATFTYDPAYRTKTLADGLGHATTYNYDLSGRPSSTVFPGNTGGTADKVTYDTYDAVGNLTQLTDGRGTVKKFHYDDADGLLTWVEYPAFPAQNVTVSYDTLDRTSNVVDGAGTSSWTYDDLGGVLTGTRTYTSLSAKTFTYSYNPDGSRASLGTPAGTFGYSYDAVGRPTQLAAPAATVNYTYLDNGWLSNRKLWSGLAFPTVNTDYAYNASGLLSSLTNKGGAAGTTWSQYSSLAYDGAFNLKSLSASVPAGPAVQSGTTTFTYDSKDRLTQESSTRFKTGGYTDNFAYDSAGNPTTVWGATRTYGLDNEEFPATFSYDGNGNETQAGAGSLQFSYDAEDRCTRMGYGGGTDFSAGYRADGLRAWKQSSQTGGTKRYFLYDGGLPLIELDSVGNVSAVNTYGPDGLACRTSGGSTVFYSFDQQGNLAQRADSTGAVLTTSGYPAFGYSASLGVPNGGHSDPFGYNAQWGYYLDREHSYYLCGHRYYDHDGGRWLTRDPIGFAGGVNLYSYCGQGPVGWFDRTGHSPTFVGWKGFEGGAEPRAQGKWFFPGDEFTVKCNDTAPPGQWGTPPGVDPMTNGLPPSRVPLPSEQFIVKEPTTGWEGPSADQPSLMDPDVPGSGVGGGNQYYFDEDISKFAEKSGRNTTGEGIPKCGCPALVPVPLSTFPSFPVITFFPNGLINPRTNRPFKEEYQL